MTALEMQQQQLQRLCLNNAEALDFVQRWLLYVHAIDDIEDGPTTAEFRLATHAAALELYTHPFFLRHAAALKPVVLACANAYADTVAWEKSRTGWQREFAEHYRHFGAELLLAVAGIVGGYAHLRAVSPELRAFHWSNHHGETWKAESGKAETE